MNRDYLKILKNYPALQIHAGKKHTKVVHPDTRDFVTPPSTPGSKRSLKNFQAEVHRLATTGRGMIWLHKGAF